MRTVTLLSLLLLARMAGAQTAALPTGTGLQAAYYNGTNFEQLVLRRRDAAIDFSWNKRPPVPGLGAEYFSVRWEGYLLAPTTGVYEFSTVMDDGLRVWLGSKLLLNAWREQDHVPAVVRIRLEAGRYYPLRVDYFQTILDTRALLRWRLPTGGAPVAVGSAHLFAALPASARPIPPAPAAPPPGPVPAPTVATTPPAPQPAMATRPRAASRRAAPAARRAAAAPAVASVPPVAAPPTDSLPDLTTLNTGTALTLRHLYFEQGKARLLPTSQPELNRLVRALRAQQALRFEIAGHTDNVGDAAKNQQLSEQRARVVRAYLVQRGIDSVRLTAVGYGGARPVADNRDPQQRPRNRRVELVAR
ncbi:hypothetical protein GCM10027048_32850 [Hymenobacter coalescens]